METINAFRPNRQLAVFPTGLNKFDPAPADDLLLLQKHRERLLEFAEMSPVIPTGAGCVSDISIVENIMDSGEYRDALKEIGRLLQSSSELANAPQRLELRVEIKANGYDDCGVFESIDIDASTEDCQVYDDDTETIGYLAWVAR